MKFKYQKRTQSLNPAHPWTLKPLIEMTLSYQRRRVRLWALLDSGADVSIFDTSLATLLGIELETGLPQQFAGITGRTTGYFHHVTLDVIGMHHPLPVAVAFAEMQGIKAVLGQADFFQHHTITFARATEQIEIQPVKL